MKNGKTPVLRKEPSLALHQTFNTSDDAFNWLYPTVNYFGLDFAGTKALFNIGFIIKDPTARNIDASYRNFSTEYAEAEWQWYKSGDPSVEKLGEIYGKVPPIWDHMKDDKGMVRSNYGWQWNRGSQLEKVIDKLRTNKEDRQAVISIYDGKEIDTYGSDTPCTSAIMFTIVDQKLNMSVQMRSNDVWFGYCNDQYCFSKLMEEVADELGVGIGWYYHWAFNMHIYERHLNKI